MAENLVSPPKRRLPPKLWWGGKGRRKETFFQKSSSKINNPSKWISCRLHQGHALANNSPNHRLTNSQLRPPSTIRHQPIRFTAEEEKSQRECEKSPKPTTTKLDKHLNVN